MTDLATRNAYGVLTDPATLTIQRLLPGPIERIWAYLTESDLRRQWLAAGEMELKLGAPVEFVWRNDELTNRCGAGMPRARNGRAPKCCSPSSTAACPTARSCSMSALAGTPTSTSWLPAWPARCRSRSGITGVG